MKPLLMAAQADILLHIKQGNVFEFGRLLEGLSPDEQLVWSCLEVGDDPINDRIHRVVFDVHYFDVPFQSIIAHVNKESNKVKWSRL